MTILAIDLGKGKSVFCNLDILTGEVEFGRATTTERGFRWLIKRTQPDRVVIEICPLAGWVHDLVRSMNIEIQVADPTQEAWKWKNVKRKTDQDDALKLARLSALGQLNLVHIPEPHMRRWRRLIEQRQTLIAERTRCKNRIRALLLQEQRELPPGKRGWTLKALEELHKLAQPLAQCQPTELWPGMLEVELQRLGSLDELLGPLEAKLNQLARNDPRTVLVGTIPGVGTRTAEVIVAVLDNPRRFKTARQVACYAGLTPRRFQSGRMDHQGRISKRGSRLLRQALNQAAWAAVRFSPWFRAVFWRISAGRQARKKLAIVAVMRKLLVVAWAMLRDGRGYRAPQLAQASEAA